MRNVICVSAYQVWTTGTDPQIQGLLKKGYRLIMSNYDALYLDCGFGAWVGTGLYIILYATLPFCLFFHTFTTLV